MFVDYEFQPRYEDYNKNATMKLSSILKIFETTSCKHSDLVKDNILKLGPFQGPVACYEIGFGKGVCGTAWNENKTIIVKDVEEFPGHIACSSLSRSEIVVPIFKENKIIGVLDIDSKEIGTFDETDKEYLESAMKILSENLV